MLALKNLESPLWEQWLSNGRYTKTVRKVKPTQLEHWSEEWEWEKVGAAAAGTPMLYSEFPKKLRSAQVTGWSDKVLASETKENSEGIVICINSDLEMSPGKAAAQAAHALMKYSLVKEITSESVIQVEEISFSVELPESDFWVQDAGLTEIPAGSWTACVRH